MPPGYVCADGVDWNEVWYGPGSDGTGIAMAVDMYREVAIPVIGSLALPWGNKIFEYGLDARNGFQKLAAGQRPDRKEVVIAAHFPRFNKFGYAVGTDLDTLRLTGSKRLNMALNRPFREHPEHLLRQQLRCMMLNPGTLNATYGFFNGEFATEEKITTPPDFQSNTFAANHQHYYRTNAASMTCANITDAKQTIRHHGNGGDLVGFINSAQVGQLEKSATFTQNSIIRSPVTDEVSRDGFKDKFLLLGVTFYATEMIPADYSLIVEASQTMEDERPLIAFEPENMNGLMLFPGPNNDYPLIDSFFETWIGYKVWRRGAGVALQIGTGGTTYTDPTITE